jgi:competence CoiA-like predicted nuclease
LNIINQDEGAAAEIALYAKNTATLEEYVHRANNFNSTYLNKLQKWITKKKYTITVPPGSSQAPQAPADGGEE